MNYDPTATTYFDSDNDFPPFSGEVIPIDDEDEDDSPTRPCLSLASRKALVERLLRDDAGPVRLVPGSTGRSGVVVSEDGMTVSGVVYTADGGASRQATHHAMLCLAAAVLSDAGMEVNWRDKWSFRLAPVVPRSRNPAHDRSSR